MPTGSPARTLLVRCWFERDGEAVALLRGTVSELSGEPLGAFETIAGLGTLLGRLLHRPLSDRPGR